ncbi:MAG: ribosomal protein S18-alanine N-acetyltransferase [Armatimonadota bacterium]
MPAGLVLAPMEREHVAAVHALEHRLFHGGWSLDAYLGELGNPSSLWWVAARDGRVLGFGGLSVIIDEAHVTSLAVEPEARGLGIGERLLVRMLADAAQRGAVRATLEVAARNTVAQALYRKLGFEHAAIRKGYYPDGDDADILWAHGLDGAPWRDRFLEIVAASRP